MSQLSAALQRANRDQWSYREIERRAERAGHPLNIATISRYMTGKHPESPSPKVLRGFAAAFGISLDALTADAEVPEVRSRFELPAEAAVLDDQERQAIVQLVRVMASRKQPTPKPTPAPVDSVESLQDLDPEALDLAAYSDADGEWLQRRRDDAERGEESQADPYDD